MIEKDEGVCAALSGGKDSAVMLHALNKLRKKYRFRLVGLSIDEGTTYRKASIAAAKQLAKATNIDLRIIRFEDVFGESLDSMVKRSRYKPCTICSVFRRTLLNLGASVMGCTKVAIGHAMDDCIHSFLLNIVRNETKRLCRLYQPVVRAAGFVQRIRPLQEVEERAVLTYALLHRIPCKIGRCPYTGHDVLRWETRNYVDHLYKHDPQTKRAIYNASVFLASTLSSAGVVKGGLHMCKHCGMPTSGTVCKACRIAIDLFGEPTTVLKERVSEAIGR